MQRYVVSAVYKVLLPALSQLVGLQELRDQTFCLKSICLRRATVAQELMKGLFFLLTIGISLHSLRSKSSLQVGGKLILRQLPGWEGRAKPQAVMSVLKGRGSDIFRLQVSSGRAGDRSIFGCVLCHPRNTRKVTKNLVGFLWGKL